MEIILDVKNTNFHPALKDVENMFWFFFLSIKTLTDDDIRKLLKKKNDEHKGYLSFNEMLDKFDKATDLQIEYGTGTFVAKLNVLSKMIFIGKAMAIVIYEFLNSTKKYNSIKGSQEFRFLYHIRNGSAHDNKFCFKYKDGNWSIGENEKIEWNGLIISRDLHDKSVFNDFISLINVFQLAKYFSDKLITIDQQTI